jgi:dihydrolipoamide dehydrogenase
MEATVSRLASGIKLLLKSNGVNSVEGEAHIDSQTKNKIVVNGETVESKNIVLATGSYPVCLPVLNYLYRVSLAIAVLS